MEDPGRTILAGEDRILERQIDASAIDEIDDRQALPHRDLLCPQDLGDRLRPPRPCLHGRVVGHDNGRPPFDPADYGDDTRTRSLSFVAVIRHQQADLENRRPRIQQTCHPLARRQFALLVLLGNLGRATAVAQLRLQGPKLCEKLVETIRHGTDSTIRWEQR